MNKITDNQTTVIRTDRGLSVAGTRITIYQIMDCLKADMSAALICERFRLTIRQITDVMEYIKNHHDEVESEYRQILEQAENNRQYWETRNQKRMAEIAAMSPKPGQGEIWHRLQQWKTKLAQSQSGF